jgi:hypothetical protein
MAHWRELNPSDYLGAWDFAPGEEKIVKIKKIEKRKVKELQGAEKVVMELEGSKPVMLNSTNLKRIEKVLGSSDYSNWIGSEIILITEKTQSVQDRSEIVDAIRVKRERPKTKLQSVSDEQFDKLLNAIKKGEWTKEDAKTKRALTPEQIKKVDELQVPSK